jgi:hypothetical protein
MGDDDLIARLRLQRAKLLGWHLPRVVSEYPLEVVASFYGVFAALAVLLPHVNSPSTILGQLPPAIETLWGATMALASLTMLWGLRPPRVRLDLVSRGVMLFGIITIAFGTGILAHYGWDRLLSGTFLVGAGVVAALRSLKLRVDYYTALETLTDEHRRNGDSGTHAKEG